MQTAPIQREHIHALAMLAMKYELGQSFAKVRYCHLYLSINLCDCHIYYLRVRC